MDLVSFCAALAASRGVGLGLKKFMFVFCCGFVGL